MKKIFKIGKRGDLLPNNLMEWILYILFFVLAVGAVILLVSNLIG